jgi:hypothetical protein
MAFALAEDFGIALVEEFGMTARAASRIAVALGERTAMTEAATEASPLIAATTEGEGAIAAEMPGTIDLADATRLATQAAGAYIAGTAIARTTKKRKVGKGKSLPTAQQPYQPPERRKGGPQDTPMPPKGVSTATHWYDRTRRKWIKRKRPLRKRPSMKKKAYKKRTVRKTTRRTYKKKRTVKRKYMRASASTEYGTHGIIHRNEVSYFGFAANGGRDEFLHCAADAVLRSWAGRFNCSIPSPDNGWSIPSSNGPQPKSYEIAYRRNKFALGGEAGTATGSRKSLNVDSHKQMANDMANQMRELAETGYYPYKVTLYQESTGTDTVFIDDKFGDMLLNVTSTMKIKMRNITNPDNAVGDMVATQKNPLQGYAYQFSGEVPIPKDILRSADSELDKFMHRDNDRGIMFGPQGVAQIAANQDAGRDDQDGMDGAPAAVNAGSLGTDKYFSTPPVGSSVFKNCTKSHAIVLPVGREVKHTIKCAYKGTLSGFMQKFNSDTYKLSSIGNCFWLGLRQKFRNSTTITNLGVEDDGHDHVSIEYDVDTIIRGGARMARPETGPKEVKRTELNSIVAGE